MCILIKLRIDMIDFTQGLTLAQISFGVAVIAFALFWYVFVKEPSSEKKLTKK